MRKFATHKNIDLPQIWVSADVNPSVQWKEEVKAELPTARSWFDVQQNPEKKERKKLGICVA